MKTLHLNSSTSWQNFALTLALLVSVRPTPAGTITVTTLNNSGPGSLRQSLVSAADGDTIDASGVSGTILLTSGELMVTNSVTITGPGPAGLAVAGNGSSRVFHIGSNTVVTISSLTITNGFVSGTHFPNNAGGGIYNDHSTLTVSNCTFSGNVAQFGFGGGIYHAGSGEGSTTLMIANSTINSNAGGVGGGIYNDRGWLTISNCLLSLNSAGYAGFGGGSGGSIYNNGETGSAVLTLVNSILNGNSAIGLFTSGGGILNSGGSSSASLIISNCALIGNSAESGGGLCNTANNLGTATMTIVNSTLTSNSASAVGGGIGNFDHQSGGVVTLKVSGSTLCSDSAYNGGGIDNDSGSPATIESSTFIQNSANLGGAIVNYGAGTISNCIMSGNSASNAGGGIANLAQLTVLQSTISSNSASGSSGGGGVFNNGAVTIANSTFAGNVAPVGGGICNDPFGAAGILITVGSSILKVGALGQNIYSSSGTVTSLGYNLSSDNGGGYLIQPTDLTNTDPLLGPLQDNGGPTFSHALLPGSPAIDKGTNFGVTIDQRGRARPFDFSTIPNASGGDGSDIGAFEYIPSSPQLNVKLAGTNVVLSWSTNDFGFILESTPALAAPSNIWSTVPGTPAVVGSQFSVVNGPVTSNNLYRLRAP